MRQIFNYNQLVVMWTVGIIVCMGLVSSYGAGGPSVYLIYPLLIVPLLIVGGLLVITFSNGESQEETAQKLARNIIQDLEKIKRKRDASFVKCWKKGMSDEELAKKFDLKIQGVKALKERLKGG